MWRNQGRSVAATDYSEVVSSGVFVCICGFQQPEEDGDLQSHMHIKNGVF